MIRNKIGLLRGEEISDKAVFSDDGMGTENWI